MSDWSDSGKAEFCAVTDREALAAFHDLCRLEGIIPALESVHAVAEAKKRAKKEGRGRLMIINLSGRGDKDAMEVARIREELRDVES